MIWQELKLLSEALVGFVVIVVGVSLTMIGALVVRGFMRGFMAAKAIEAEATEPSETEGDANPLGDALSLLLEHGDAMHVCPRCNSLRTTIDRAGYRYDESIGGMAVIVREQCNDCGNECAYLMTSVGWIAAIAHTEWGMWMLAQDSSNLHLDIGEDLGRLGEQGLDGPVG